MVSTTVENFDHTTWYTPGDIPKKTEIMSSQRHMEVWSSLAKKENSPNVHQLINSTEYIMSVQ